MEKLGIPTVTIISSKFVGLAETVAQGLGIAGLSLVIVPHPIEFSTKLQAEAKADAAFPDILKAATRWEPPLIPPPQAKTYPAETVKVTGSVEDVNDFFFAKGWSTGVPVIPPSREGVEKMLKGTSRCPDEVVCIVPPRGGALTVEMVAVHAVMAGAKPEFMPVILAVIDAMKQDEYDWKATVTTGPTAPVVIVNGPIVKEIGIGYSTGAGGTDYKANISIGLAISSIANIVGGCKHPTPNMSIIGVPWEIIAPVMGENEDALPEGWQPFHVEMGYKKTDSVVSVKACRGFDMLGENGHGAEAMLKTFTKSLDYGKSCFLRREMFLIIPPQPAALLAMEGWTKEKIREYLWENARSPISSWRRGHPKDALTSAKKMEGFAERYGPITADTLVPVLDKPEEYKILVIGGAGTHSYYYQSAHGRLVTKLIER